ncbi:N-succinylglutamate 5-semialdehyde dehydrogenase [Caulobacter sp. Root655]|uniref:succinylglutamate-semialdehyde dehydrogenase n=1 Tax=Caulobacter sp. Root655 TaxID=1736578 RepID=UPI0006FCFD09|nr:succinylglutamate-semialdehyde dehydrogenase [Caulobacter sp. Root655]KRA60408.1 N-succinylglutamate 5-semialdehyde dehydrogenase [Caulobacter sp. Root655]
MSGGVFIDGVWRAGAGAEAVSIDPTTGEVIWRQATAGVADVVAAVAAARKAFPAWADRSRDERVAILRRYKDVLVARTADYAQALSRETGKALWETTAELGSMAGKVEASIKAYEERTGEHENAMAFGRAVLRHRPHGVMVVLGPFNFPGHLPNGHIVPALLAGDTVVFKPSEETPLAGQLLVEALEAAGVPAGVVNLVQGGRQTGQALLDQEIDGLLFTGSAQAGAFFRRYFADRPDVILALELGGNNPLVVWDAGEAEAVAALVVQSAFITTGQRCSCARRLIVRDDAGGQAVIDAVAALSERLVVGPWNGGQEPFMGPLISDRAAATALAGAEAMAGKTVRAMTSVEGLSGAFVSPGLVDVTGETIPDEELFAPLLQVRRVDSLDAAIAAANATRYGLSAGLISNETAHWDHFFKRIRAGVVNWNRPTTGAAGTMPFGGLGASGNHRPSAYYAADYCAYPVASFEAASVTNTLGDIKGLRE